MLLCCDNDAGFLSTHLGFDPGLLPVPHNLHQSFILA